MRNLTNEEMERLSQLEGHFHKAVVADYCPYPGDNTLREMQALLNELNGTQDRVDVGCQHCTLRVMKAMGIIYFAQKERNQAAMDAENERIAVELSQKAAKVRRVKLDAKLVDCAETEK